MRRLISRVLVLATLALIARVTEAQTVRGVVASGDTPVPGVIVLLLDAQSAVVARALTNESGEYRVSSSQPGTYRVRTLRIGFKPVISAPIELAAGEDVTRRIALDDIPVSLETVNVSARNVCSIRSDTAAATFGIWDQVRGALTAAKLTSSNTGYTARSVVYTRTLEAGRRGRVLSQFARTNEGRMSQPFKSIPAESLSKVGYVTTDLQGISTFNAPDIDVLLSDAFVADHCLRVSPESNRQQVGIALAPTYERTNMPEIEGTVWVDRQMSELRRLDFSYVNLTREQSVGNPGGFIEFVRLRDGAWMISRWEIRLPVVEMRPQMSGVAGAITSSTEQRQQFFVREVHVQGGELVFVRRRGAGDTLWSRPPRLLAGTVRDSASGSAINGAVVRLRGSKLADTSDIDGRFTIDDVLPGEYLIDVQTTPLVTAGITHAIPFVFVDSTTTVDARIPSPDQILASYCADAAAGVVAGSVRLDGDSVPPYNVKVVAEWYVFAIDGDMISRVRRVAEARPNSHGDYRLCNVPPNTDLYISADNARAEAVLQKLRIPPGQRFMAHDVVLTLKPSRSPPRADATLTGRVLDETDRRPIPAAYVALSGMPRNASTDSAGRFTITDVPAGTHELSVRKVGYKPSAQSITVRADERVDRTITLSAIQTLATVEVRKTALIPSFEEHRRIGQGTFITRAELAKAEGRKTSELLATVPGISMVRGSGRAWVYSNRNRAAGRPNTVDRTDASSGARQGVCYSHVYIDQAQIYGSSPKMDPRSRSIPEPLFDINTIPPDQIEAIEYYASSAQVPVRYARLGSSCGVLVIHTRRP